MPTSSMTIVGNLLFAPFLTIFLFLSTLICTATILHIPCGWICSATNWWHALWMKLLRVGSSNWLIYSHQQLVLIFVFIAGVGFLILHARAWYQSHRIAGLTASLVIAWLCSYYSRPIDLESFSIGCGRSTVEVSMGHGQIMVTDQEGALSRMGDAKNWIRYQLAGELIKHCGTPHIHTFSEKVGNYRSYKALGQLSALLQVEYIQCPAPPPQVKKRDLYVACIEQIANVRNTSIRIV